jgi:hypothetical protein
VFTTVKWVSIDPPLILGEPRYGTRYEARYGPAGRGT